MLVTNPIREIDVTVRQRSLHPHLNSYHHNESLLFQFILSEFLAIHAELAPLRKLTTPPRSTAQCDAILTPVVKLAGASFDTMRLFVWNQETGLLSKFKNYCGLYAQHRSEQPANKHVQVLHQNANQAWLYCMHCLDLLHTLKDKGINAKTGESLCKTNAKLLNCLNRIMKALVPLLGDFTGDENVLFFIVRHSSALDAIFGERFTALTLSTMDPKGLAGVENLLTGQYTKRGFDHLLPLIKTQISLLSP
ncbi:MAG: hypothetical protein LLG04_14600 [Parachlamydia sp.]|nr:hypothetical protein [Parachlamydia sp.]